MRRIACNVCGSTKTKPVIDLGLHALADTFWPKTDPPDEYQLIPLKVVRCSSCMHMFNEYIVSAKLRYQGVPYSYTTGNSKSAIDHFHFFAEQTLDKIQNIPKSVIDIGGNDGTLLSAFEAQGIQNLINLEPSSYIASLSETAGITTINDFFTSSMLKKHRISSDLIVSANVLNHVDDLDDFMQCVSSTLNEDGSFVFQVPYAGSLISNCYFETIYHEHVNYFSGLSISKMMEKNGFFVFAHQMTDYMCDSIRVYCKKGSGSHSTEFKKLITEERESGFMDDTMYTNFESKAKEIRNNLRHKLSQIILQNKKIIGFCAATKANTLLNYCGFSASDISCIADTSVHKINKLMPGSLIPIVDEKTVRREDYDYAIVLAENFVRIITPKLEKENYLIIRIRDE
jgi:2-polyprenyl-3-methyl-5-hydroxy-6-metoxy-1,4-benzoquinol methylase